LHTRNWQRYYRGIYSDAYLDGPLAEDHLRMWRERFSRFNERDEFIRVACEDGRTVGLAYAMARAGDENGVLLENLHVEPAYQGRGAGKQLMAEVARWAVARQLPLCLQVFAANENSVAFYRRRGGSQVREFIEELPGGGEAVVLVYQWLKPGVLI
jgi:GNAT superfamily N-acetyltransferase